MLGARLSAAGQLDPHAGLDPKAVAGGCAVVDHCNLPAVQAQEASGGGGGEGPHTAAPSTLSSAVYEWLGVGDPKRFPGPVAAGLRRSGDAKHHAYPRTGAGGGGAFWGGSSGSSGSGVNHVIHVAGPDFRVSAASSSSGGNDGRVSRDEAVAILAEAYASTLREFLGLAGGGDGGGRGPVRVLRLLPLGSGAYAGPFGAEVPGLTRAALAKGFGLLSEAHQNALLVGATAGG